MATPIPPNRASFDAQEITHATHAVPSAAVVTTGVVTDSRAVTPGCLFVALRGENHDGHAHVAAAIAAGATAVLVEADVAAPDAVAIVRVPSTLVALGNLAALHRKRWGKRVVAITGSVGKTTTRACVAAMLRRVGPVHATTGNLNNLVGLPMTLFGLEDAHAIAVVELGMSVPGEIARLAEIAHPNVGLVTRVAAAHTEGVGDVAGVAREKGALFAAATDAVVVNADDALAHAQLARAHAATRVTYGRSEGADVRLVAATMADDFGSTLIISGPSIVGAVRLATPVLGEPGVAAALAAVATASAVLGKPIDQAFVDGAFDGLQSALGDGRLRPVALANGALVLDDSYNANRASVVSGLEVAAQIAKRTGRRLVVILGEMRELGAASDEEHDAVGAAVAEAGVDFVLGVHGNASRIVKMAAKSNVRGVFVDHAEAACIVAAGEARPNDLVFVKGSRGVGLDRVVTALRALKGAA